MFKSLLLLLLPVATLAQNIQKDFSLTGDLKLSKPVDWVYLRYSGGEEFVFDSLQPKNGKFTYKGKIAEPTVATFMVKYVQQPDETKAKRESMQLFLEPVKINITATDSLEINSVTGSGAHVDFLNLKKMQIPFTTQLNNLYAEYNRQRKMEDEVAMKKLEESIMLVEDEMGEKVFGTFVKTSPNSPVALFALKQFAGWDLDPDAVEPLYNQLPASTRAWPSAVAFKEQLETAKKTAIGKPAMEFTQNDTLGNPVSLSSFKGQYVLVDFWASWCGPCRKENPNVVKAFNQFRDKKFTVLGVSLDRPNAKDKWMKAIHDDGLTWTQVSDLKFWDNEVAKLYGIRAIPQNLLIDPNGIIIGKNLSGNALTGKLEEVLK